MSRRIATLPMESSSAPTRLWDLLTPIASSQPASASLREPHETVPEPRVNRDEIVAQARAEAESIRAAAIADAAFLHEGALADAEALRAEAREFGYAEGALAARQEVEAGLHAAWEARVAALSGDVQCVLDAFADEREAVWLQTETEMIAFTLEMARKVVKVEVTQNPAILAEMIRHALRRVVDKENVRVRVNPEELDLARGDRKDLQLVLDGARSLEIIDDRRIGRGGCVIETGAGTIDARIETQFNEIARALESATTEPDDEADDE